MNLEAIRGNFILGIGVLETIKKSVLETIKNLYMSEHKKMTNNLMVWWILIIYAQDSV